MPGSVHTCALDLTSCVSSGRVDQFLAAVSVCEELVGHYSFNPNSILSESVLRVN